MNESAWLYSTCRPSVVEVWKVTVVLGAALRFEKRNQPVKSSAISMMCFGPGGSGGCRHTAGHSRKRRWLVAMVVNGNDDTRVADDRATMVAMMTATATLVASERGRRKEGTGGFGRTRPQSVESAGSVHPAAWSLAALSTRH